MTNPLVSTFVPTELGAVAPAITATSLSYMDPILTAGFIAIAPELATIAFANVSYAQILSAAALTAPSVPATSLP